MVCFSSLLQSVGADDYAVAHAQPTAPQTSQWHLFNDFLVRSVGTEEALSFHPAWKMPSVIGFQIKEANNKIDMDWKKNIDTSLLYEDNKSGHLFVHRCCGLVANPRTVPMLMVRRIAHLNWQRNRPGRKALWPWTPSSSPFVSLKLK